MHLVTVIEIIILIALVGIAFTLVQEPEEELYYSEPAPVEAPVPVIQTPVPLIEENARWGKTALSVFIDRQASENVPGFRDGFVNIFKDAAAVLTSSVNNKITFRFTTIRQNTDITVKWMPQLRADSLDAIGHTELNFSVAPSFRVISKAEIELLAQKEGRDLTDEQTFALSLHELGHALGLGHSDSKESIMFPEAQEEITTPSPVDVQSILDAYALEPLPDLRIKDAEFSKRIVTKLVFKQYLYDGRIAVINDGLSDSDEFSITISAGKSVLAENAESLRPGESIVFTLQNVSADSDFSTIIVELDKESRIRELNENNRYGFEVG